LAAGLCWQQQRLCHVCCAGVNCQVIRLCLAWPQTHCPSVRPESTQALTAHVPSVWKCGGQKSLWRASSARGLVHMSTFFSQLQPLCKLWRELDKPILGQIGHMRARWTRLRAWIAVKQNFDLFMAFLGWQFNLAICCLQPAVTQLLPGSLWVAYHKAGIPANVEPALHTQSRGVYPFNWGSWCTAMPRSCGDVAPVGMWPDLSTRCCNSMSKCPPAARADICQSLRHVCVLHGWACSGQQLLGS
jgi:hypothetical protein